MRKTERDGEKRERERETEREEGGREREKIILSPPVTPSTLDDSGSRHQENIRKWLRLLCSNQKAGFLFSWKLQQGHKQSDGSWLEGLLVLDVCVCGGG